jgi:hypothetical protein
MSNIQSNEIQIIQIPGKENGFHAICHARIATSTGQIFSAIGEAISENGDNASAKGLLQHAAQDGFNRAMKWMSDNRASTVQSHGISVSTMHDDDDDDVFSSRVTTIKPSPGKEGGGSKAISDKQKDTIINMCRKMNINSDEFARNKFNKNLSQLIGKEAHSIMQDLRNLQ